jgi:hypothetical protein
MTTPKQPEVKDFNQQNASSRPTPNAKILNYSPEELQFNHDALAMVRNARDRRNAASVHSDWMTFDELYEQNESIGLAAVEPAKDRNDIRLNPGITAEKIITAVSLSLSYNFDTEVKAFDKNDAFLRELSKASTDLIYKSNKMELWEQFRGLTYKGMATHGTFYTMEQQDFPIRNVKSNIKFADFGKLNISWDDKPRKKTVKFRTINLDPRMVIVGDSKQNDLRKQPFIAIARVVPEAEARNMFGTFDRWEYVPLRSNSVTLGNSEEDVFKMYLKDYAVSDSLQEGYVEIVYFMRSIDYGNELQIFCNGTAMLPVKKVGGDPQPGGRYKVSAFPLTAWSRSGEYPIVDWHLERTPNHFLSKGFPAKTRFDEAVVTFFFRYMVEKAIRSINPTLINNTGINLTRDMLAPGNLLTDIPEDHIKTLMPAELIQGISNGDVSMLNLIKETIDSKTMTREFQGQTVNPYQTAVQFTEQQKSQLMKLGSLVDGIIRGEMLRADLRLRNSIIPYWYSKYDYDGKTKKSRSEQVGKAIIEIYDTFSVERGEQGTKTNSVVNVSTLPKEGVTGFDVMSREERESKETGVSNRYTFLDPDKLDFMNTLFYYTVKPNERDNDQFVRTQTDGDIAVAINMFGQQSVDMEKLKERFARSRNDNYNDWFTNASIDPSMIGGGLAAGQDVRQMMQPGNVAQMGGMNPASNVPPDQASLQ